MTERQRATRDPEKRKRAIVEAAAELIIEIGITNVTHRKVAARAGVPLGSTTQHFASLDDLLAQALEYMSALVDADLQQLRTDLSEGDPVEVLAAACHRYMDDTVRVQVEAAFYVGALQNEQLVPLASRWRNGLIRALAPYASETAARSIAIYADGLMFYASMESATLDIEEIVNTIRRLMENADA